MGKGRTSTDTELSDANHWEPELAKSAGCYRLARSLTIRTKTYGRLFPVKTCLNLPFQEIEAKQPTHGAFPPAPTL